MQGHEFENNIHKQMEDLNVSPSEFVWNRLEKELRKERRKRRFLLIIPLILLIGAAGYWLALPTDTASIAITDKEHTNDLKNNSPDPSSIEKTRKKLNNEESTQKTIQKVGTKDQPVLAIKKNSIKKDTDFAYSVSDTKKTLNKSISQFNVNAKERIFVSKSFSQKESTVFAKNKRLVPKVEKGSLNNTLIPAPVDAIAQPAEKDARLPSLELKTTLIADKSTTEVVVSSGSDTVKNAIAITPPVINSNQIEVAQKKKPTINNKWQWGITATIGVGRIAQGGILNAFEKSLVLDASANNNGSQLPGSVFNLKPSALNSGVNWSTGFFIQHKRSEKVQVSAGINYNYFSTNNEIGSRVDSLFYIINNFSSNLRVLDFYRSGEVNIYKSKYHLLELPISLQLKLSKANRLPIYWNNGLSIGYLFSTNALHYDGSSGVYYKDNTLFKRTQVGFSTGFSLQLFSKTNYPLEIGPQFNYKLSKLLKSNNGDNRHLLSGSILLKWYLKK